MKPGKVFLIRHGSTAFNNEKNSAEDRIRGWINVPLNEKGRKEAAVVAKELKDKHLTHLVSSDLGRAAETAQIISRHLKVPLVVHTPELRPWNLGRLQGRPTKDVKEQMIAYMKSPTKKVPGGESFNTFKNRFLTAIKHIRSLAEAHGMNIGVVAHLRNLKVIEAWDGKGMSIDVKKLLEEPKIKPCGFCIVPGSGK